MLAHCLQRWPNISPGPTSTLAQTLGRRWEWFAGNGTLGSTVNSQTGFKSLLGPNNVIMAVPVPYAVTQTIQRHGEFSAPMVVDTLNMIMNNLSLSGGVE